MRLDYRARWAIGVLLVLLVMVTHGQHDATSLHLPQATWAAFFLGGFYLRQTRLWVLGLGLVGALDYAMVTWGGVSDFCLTPAYLFMIPAYGVLWLAGRIFAAHARLEWRSLGVLMLCCSSIVVAEILASGSFYLFSGRPDHVSLAGLTTALVTWAPSTFKAFTFWIGVAAPIHTAIMFLRGAGASRRSV
ncbi:MAG: hypothetical protein KGK17_04590 [Betaproteobacteria bacterium]|nr:hypothetical protein [Betaproteobacteria bacterium]